MVVAVRYVLYCHDCCIRRYGTVNECAAGSGGCLCLVILPSLFETLRLRACLSLASCPRPPCLMYHQQVPDHDFSAKLKEPVFPRFRLSSTCKPSVSHGDAASVRHICGANAHHPSAKEPTSKAHQLL